MKQKLSLRTIIRILLTLAAGFFIGRVGISAAIWPFAPAYVLAAFLNRRSVNPYIAFFGVSGALLTQLGALENPPATFSITILCAVFMTLADVSRRKITRRTTFFIATLSFIIGSLTFKYFLLLPLIATVIELAIALISIVVIDTAMRIFTASRPRALADGELISVSLVFMFIIAGFGGFNIAGVSLSRFFALCLTLFAAYIGGAGVGAGVGIATSLACVIAGADFATAAVIGFGGLLAGSVKAHGRWLSSLAFFITCSAGIIFVKSAVVSLADFADVFFATVIVAALPKRLTLKTSNYIKGESGVHFERFRAKILTRLAEIERVFASSGQLFIDSKASRDNAPLSTMLAEVPRLACRECILAEKCWTEDFEGSYLALKHLYDVYLETGQVHERNLTNPLFDAHLATGQVHERKLTGSFLSGCPKKETLLGAAYDIFEKYRTNRLWEQRVLEGRTVAGEQLLGVARVISGLSEEICRETRFRDDIELAVCSEFERLGIAATQVCAEVSHAGLDVRLSVVNGEQTDTEKLTDAVSGACRTAMELCEKPTSLERKTTLHFRQMREYTVQCYVSSAPKAGEEITGDAFSFENLGDGRFMMTLADGMGSGEFAARESKNAVSLIEDFYGAGFDDKTVLESINKLLMLSGSEEMFSTMDMCMVDLITGKGKFTKIGAPHSYIIRNGVVKKMHPGALPLGIVDEYKPVVQTEQFTGGEVILMFTDGISELEVADKRLFPAMISAANKPTAKEVADEILALAASIDDGDDMTVLAAKVSRRAG